MKDELHVDDPALAKVLAAQVGTIYLAPYFSEARSVQEACDYLGQPMSKVHYWTRRWLELGAVEAVERVPRNGRPITRYRCVAEKFVVPDDLLPETLLEQQLRRINQRLLDGLVSAAPQVAFEGQLSVSQVPGHRGVSHDRTAREGIDHGSSLSCSFDLLLTDDEARELRDDLMAVRDRWLERGAGRERQLERRGYTPCLTVLATTPVTG